MTSSALTFQNYQTIECLHTGSKTLVYRARRISDGQSVVLKLLRNKYPSFNELVQFQNQYTIIQNLNLAGVIQPIALEPYRNSLLLVMPDDGSISLSNYLDTQNLNAKDRLELGMNVGLQLAVTLDKLHQNRIIHKDIKPDNIIINPQTLRLKVIDFSLASKLPQETKEIQNPNTLEGTLAYMSPEQTGRMNRGIDYRSDFYALGVTLYKIFTGQLPFPSNDPLELIYAHLAQTPTAIPNLNPEIPDGVAEIINKLMAKNAEDRYQSAVGLKADLEKCWSQWKATGTIEDFTPGKLDRLAQFNIPQKLYGRENQVKILLDAFERVSQGGFELILIGGYSGVGKTALVNEILRQLTRSKGYFISGKFDQFQRNIPLDAPIKAYRRVVLELLSESQQRLDYWRDRFLNALGANARLMIDTIPELELIIGKQPPVPELGAIEAARRLGQTFDRFASCFSSQRHPVALFLDDWQWADSATLVAYQGFLTTSGIHHSFQIAAYRDNEVSPTHPFIQMIESAREAGLKITEIILEPLQLIHVAQLVADTLHTSVERVMSLAELLFEKTDGNPFFLTQLLKSLYENGLIWFDLNTQKWQWNLKKIQQQGVTDNVVELMISRMGQLPETSRNALKLAACIGNQFDLQTLAVVAERTIKEMAQDLWLGIRDGFIIPLGETYKAYTIPLEIEGSTPEAFNCTCRFLHDRVQQAAYQLIPTAEKQKTHYHIGQLLLAQTPSEIQGEKIFELVRQLNHGISLICDRTERDQLAELNLLAARKAKGSAAYQMAQNYCEIGIRLLPKTAWKTHYKLIYALHREGSEACYLCGNFQQAEALYAKALAQAKTVLDQAVIYRIQMTQYQLQGRNLEAIAIQRQSLRLFGWEVPETPDQIETHLYEQIAIVNQFLEQASIESILELPRMQDAEIAEMLRILQILFYSAWLAGQTKLALLAVAKMTTLSLKHGNSDLSPFGYVGYGMVAKIMLNHPQIAYRFGMTAVQLCEQFQNPDIRGMTNFLFASDVHSWSRPLREVDLYYENALRYSMEAGNWLTVAFTMMLIGADRLIYGKNLRELYEIVQTHAEFLQQIQSLENLEILIAGVQQPTRHLLGLTEGRGSFDDDQFSEAEYLEKYANDPFSVSWFYYGKICNAYLLNQSDQYSILIPKLEIIETTVPTHAKVPSTTFYVALMHLSLVESENLGASNFQLEEQYHWQTTIALEEKLNQWQQSCPENIQHKYLLIQAEKARLQNQIAAAIDFYDQAITHAQTQGYIHEAALANELAAKFYLNWGKEKIAQSYLIEAYHCYARWGAKLKTEQLEQEYPNLLDQIIRQNDSSSTFLKSFSGVSSFSSHVNHSTGSSSSTSLNHLLDLASIIKVSQALSDEIELEKLVPKLMQMILENSGATKGVLIFNREKCQCLTIEAVATQTKNSEQNLVVSQTAVPIIDSQDIPLKLINSVQRQLEPVVVDDVLNQPEYASDRYFLDQQPKSLLCIPILSANRLLAILYLENRLIAHAFTADRIEVLKLLCSQAAISLKNAQLYRQSQDYADQLQTSQEILKSVLDNIPQMIGWKDRDGVFLGCNQKRAEVMGFNSPAEVVGKTDFDMPWTPEEAEWYHQCDRQVMESGQAQLRIIESQQQADGKQAWLESNKVPLRNAEGEVFGMLATVEDITERREAEETLKRYNEILESQVAERTAELQKSTRNLEAAQRIAKLGNWELDISTGQLSGSEETYRIVGDELSNFEEVAKLHPPEDFARAQQAIAQAIETGEGYELELPIIRPNAEPGYLYLKAEVIKNQDGQVTHLFGTVMDITERKAAELENQKLLTILEATSDFIGMADLEGNILYINSAGRKMVGLQSIEAAKATQVMEFFPDEEKLRVEQEVLPQVMQGVWQGELIWQHFQTQALIPIEESFFVVNHPDTDQPIGIAGIARDITERKKIEAKLQQQTQQLKDTLKELKHTQAQMIQSEKMSSLGQIVAGVAHEINNPVNFIHANLDYAEQYSQDLFDLMELYQEYYPDPTEEIQEKIEEIDLEYIQEDYPKLLKSMKNGTERISSIVLSLRNFSRLDEAELKDADINQGLESTLLILQNRLKQTDNASEIELVKNYGDLPNIQCYPGQLNQVFMNLLNNALDALENQEKPGQIQIKTEWLDSNCITIRIADNGPGISKANLDKVFDPFYTTKPVGKGTGLGLSTSYQIITDKHQGKIYCHSVPGEKTEFTIELPIKS